MCLIMHLVRFMYEYIYAYSGLMFHEVLHRYNIHRYTNGIYRIRICL